MMVGWYPGGRGYRAPYGANKTCQLFGGGWNDGDGAGYFGAYVVLSKSPPPASTYSQCLLPPHLLQKGVRKRFW